VFAAAYLKSKTFLDFWPDFFSKVNIYLFEQAQPILKGSMMINTFIFVVFFVGLYQLKYTNVSSFDIYAFVLYLFLNIVPQIV
jgi:hypothetical protein